MRLKKVLALLLALAMVFALASCTVEQNPTPTNDPGETTPGTETQQVSIEWWAFPTFGNATGYEEELIAAFNEVHPEIEVKLTIIDFTSGPQTLTAAIEADTAPDVLFDAPGRIIEYGKAGELADLNDIIGEASGDMSEAVLSACSDGTDYWMYPLSSAPFYMGINLEMFEAAGADQYLNLEGDRAWTTEDFQNACKALADAGYTPGIVYCGGQGGDQGTRALVNNLYSGQFTNADHTAYTADSEENIKGLQLLVDLVNEGVLTADPSIVAGDEIALFCNGTAKMSFCWNASAAVSNKASLAEGIDPLPMAFPSDDGVPELCGGIWGFGIFDNGDEAKAAAAKEFIKFVCDDAEQGPQSVYATGFFPVRASFGDIYTGTDKAENAEFAIFMPYLGDYYNVTPGWNTQRTEWWNMLQRIFAGGDVATEVGVYVTNSNASITQ